MVYFNAGPPLFEEEKPKEVVKKEVPLAPLPVRKRVSVGKVCKVCI